MVSVTTLRSIHELDALAGPWNDLLARSANNHVFLTWECASCWARTYLKEGQLRCLTAYEDEQLIAIAPFWLDNVRVGGFLPVRVLRFLGDKEVCADYLDLIVEAKNCRPPVEAIWHHLFGELGREWDILEYHQVPSGSVALQVFYTLARQDRRCIRRAIDGYNVCPYVVLPGTWEEYLAELSVNQRRALRVATRRLAEHGPVELRMCTNLDVLPVEMERLIALNRRTWHERGQPGSFATPEFRRFHDLLAEEFLAQGRLFLCSLHVNDRHLGSFYGFGYNRTVYFYVIGVDRPQFPRINMVRVLLGMCIQEAIRRGYREFDLLRGDEEYKYHWTDCSRRNLSLSFYNRTARALAHVVYSTGRALTYVMYRFVSQFTKRATKTILRRGQPVRLGRLSAASPTPDIAP